MTIATATICPFCGARHEEATSISGGRTPTPGDVTLCFDCGEWCVFDNPGTLRKPTDAEYLGIGFDKRLQRVRAAWRAVKP